MVLKNPNKTGHQITRVSFYSICGWPDLFYVNNPKEVHFLYIFKNSYHGYFYMLVCIVYMYHYTYYRLSAVTDPVLPESRKDENT